MKSFLRNVVQRKESGGGLLGRTVKVGPYTVRVESHIADGGFASLYKVRDLSTTTAYALKHMRLMGDHEAIADCQIEVDTLKKLRGVPSVLTLRAVAFSGVRGQEQEAYLLLDLCRDNLVDFMRGQENKLSTAVVLQIFSAVCQAVAAMHHQTPPLAHRDLKAENVLQHKNGEWVLCDFGSASNKPALYESSDAVLMGEEIIRKYTTPAYRAPEMWDLYSRERIDTKADIWALGCLLYFLLFGKLAFQAEAKLQILNGEFSIPPTRPPPLAALLRELLVVNPVNRPNIDQVLARLQQVSQSLGVDPALLAPRPVSKAVEDVPASAPDPPAQATPPPPPMPALPATPIVQPARASSFTRAPPASSSPSPATTSTSPAEPLVNLDNAPLFRASASDEDPPSFQASPPRSQRSLLHRSRASSLEREPHGSTSAGDSAALRKQVCELQAQNQALQATVRSQQATIKQLQVDNHNQATQLKRLGHIPPPAAFAAAAEDSGWAKFDSPPEGAFPSDTAPLPHVRTPGSLSHNPSLHRTSPQRPRLANGGGSMTSSPQRVALERGESFDPFGIQAQETASPMGVASPSTDGGSAATETLSETMSRHSALSAFAESLKQPALINADEDGDPPGSPLQDNVRVMLKHRRSSSEPTPFESWHIYAES